MKNALAQRRILFVLPTLDLGGAERQAVLLARWLRRQADADVAVAALFGGTRGQVIRLACAEARLPCLRFNMPDMRATMPTHAALRQFARELRFLHPAIVMPYLSTCNVMCGLAWRAARAGACVWNQRDAGIDLPDAGPQRSAAAQASLLVANSSAGAACLTERLGVPPERIMVVPNAVEKALPRMSRAAWRKRLGAAPDQQLACMVANITRHKDHATLLRAWSRVCHGVDRPSRLLLAGALVDNVEPLRALAEELHVSEHVTLLGPVDDIAGLLHACDLAIHSSRAEGLPNAVLEAMAAGLAVVATDLPGTRLALGERQWPYLSLPGDDAHLASSIVTLLGDDRLRADLGALNRARVTAEFGMDRLGSRMAAALSALLDQPRRSSTT